MVISSNKCHLGQSSNLWRSLKIVNGKKNRNVYLVCCHTIQLPETTEELFAVTIHRHLNFFESLIHANVRKEAESIPSIVFEFWTNKKVKKNFLTQKWTNFSTLIWVRTLQKFKKPLIWCRKEIKKEDFVDEIWRIFSSFQ